MVLRTDYSFLEVKSSMFATNKPISNNYSKLICLDRSFQFNQMPMYFTLSLVFLDKLVFALLFDAAKNNKVYCYCLNLCRKLSHKVSVLCSGASLERII